jgi:DNA-binding transcriptional MerR regulator
MRISELADDSGVPVPTIESYLREGLLPAGTPRTARLTEYDERHVRRPGLLRLLREVAGVPIDGLRRLVAASEGAALSVHELFATAADTLAPAPPPAADEEPRAQTRALADGLVEQAGWTNVRRSSPGPGEPRGDPGAHRRRRHAPPGPRGLAPYVRWADEIARYELGHLGDAQNRLGLLEEMVVARWCSGTCWPSCAGWRTSTTASTGSLATTAREADGVVVGVAASRMGVSTHSTARLVFS